MAGRPKSYTQQAKAKVEGILDALPEKPESERPLSTTELVKQLKSKIAAAQAKGYTLEEIVEQFKKAGVQVSLSTLKSGLKGKSKSRSANDSKGSQGS